MAIGALHVRRSILIGASPERVWQEFETPERIAGWLDRGHKIHVFETELGGRVEMSVEIDGTANHYGGRVRVFDPGRELSLDSNWQGDRAWSVPTFWTIRLTPHYDGTVVELFHHGFERLGAEAADNLQGYEEGWGMQHLVALRELAEG